MTSLGGAVTAASSTSAGLSSLQESVRGAAASSGLHTVGRNLAEHVSDHAEHLDFFSENSIGACVTCCVSLVIWLVCLPIFHLGAVPYMEKWEAMHTITLVEYMHHAEETFPSPFEAFKVLDGDGDGKSTLKEFSAGSAIFKRPPFRYPADMYPIFNEIDANKDGLLQSKEFYVAAPSGMPQKWHLNMTDLKVRAKDGYGFLDSYYTAMDINSDGKVDLPEFVAMAKDLQPPVLMEDAKMLFHTADKDGKGFIEPREWVSYKVHGNFSWQVTLEPGISPTGSRVMKAVEAGLRSVLHILQFDLLTIVGVEDITYDAGATASSRRLVDNRVPKLNVVILRINFNVLIGTRARQSEMQSQASALPNNVFSGAFGRSISGGSTTLPAGPPPTSKPQRPGPVKAEDLEAYMNVPAVIQGHTELLLSHAKAGVHSIEDQEKALKPIFKAAVNGFCKCSINVESVQTTVVQDETGAGLPTNKSMVISWSMDLKHGGEFERELEDRGHQLVSGIYHDIMKADLPSMVGVKLESWTRFSATYYGLAAATLPRGTTLKQRFGHYQGGVRNDTGSPPFVSHP